MLAHMVRTIVQLTEDQAAALKRLARQRRTSVAAIVREAVDEILEGRKDPERRSERAERARALAGSMDSGLGDLAENHDVYLADALRPSR